MPAEHVHAHPYPLVFATLSGDHLYGFASTDSEFDLRGAHLLPLAEIVGLDEPKETVNTIYEHDGMEIDLVTLDLKLFIGRLLKSDGAVLEQLYSPHVLHTSPVHDELKELGKRCITRHHARHYLEFSAEKWKAFIGDGVPKVEMLLYGYRALLAGIHLMRTGEIEANLQHLNEDFQLPYLSELSARKRTGTEEGAMGNADLEFHEGEYRRLTDMLVAERDRGKLPERSDARADLNDLLVRTRLAQEL
ncbi:MAG: nucleotidyltransferase domain-containing protein [Acidobacteriota bacterium]|nr:nucleotidyltransferase domain-containing protein [Acidobacteriota bacterium]